MTKQDDLIEKYLDDVEDLTQNLFANVLKQYPEDMNELNYFGKLSGGITNAYINANDKLYTIANKHGPQKDTLLEIAEESHKIALKPIIRNINDLPDKPTDN